MQLKELRRVEVRIKSQIVVNHDQGWRTVDGP